MSNLRAIFWLSVILMLSLGTFWFQGRLGSTISKRDLLRGDRLSTDRFEPISVAISSADGSCVALERKSGWQLVKPFRAAADERVILKFLDALRALTVIESVSESELLRFGRERRDIGLDPVRFTVTLSDGVSHRELLFGDPTPSSNAVYAAVGGSDAILVVNGVLAPAELKPEAFRVREIFPQGTESIVSFTIRQTAGRLLSFARTGENWCVGEKPASAAKVTEFLRNVASARVVDFKWPTSLTNETVALTDARLSGFGLDSDSAVAVTFRSFDGTDRRLAFGSETEGLSYALVHEGSAVVTVDAALKAAALQSEDSFADARLFPFEESSVRSFTLSQDGVDCIVARGAEGFWRLDAPIAAPAEPTAVKTMLGRLLALSTADVAPTGLSVAVNTNGTRQTVSPKRVLAGSRLEDLRGLKMICFDPEGVKRLVVTEGADKSSAVVRDRENRLWRFENGRAGLVDAKKVARLLAALDPLLAVRTVALKATPSELKAYGLETPFLTVAVDQDLEGAVRRNIFIGVRTKGGRYATVGSSDAVFQLSDKVVETLRTDLGEKD